MRAITRQLKKVRAIYRRETGPLPPRLSEGMHRLHNVLQSTTFKDKFWINGGLLLGLIRTGGPLPHDPDVDFSFWRADREHLLAVIPQLKQAGFRTWKRWINNDQEPTEWSLKYRGVSFEFFEMHEANQKMRWYCYGGNPAEEFLNEAPMHGLATCEVLGRTWLKPDDHDTYLHSLYGDWRTPNPDYNYCTDSQAIIRRHPWSGKNKW